MSPLRKVIKHKIATKTQRLQDKQSVEKQLYIFDKTLCLCVFVAKKRLFRVASFINLLIFKTK